MAIKKIPCGGWLYDDEQITFEDGVMRVIGGGYDGMLVVQISYDEETEDFSCNHTYEEISEAFPKIIFVDDEGLTGYACGYNESAFYADLLSCTSHDSEDDSKVGGITYYSFVISSDNTITFSGGTETMINNAG